MNHLGQLHHVDRVDPSVLDDDPFWSVVRRRHPEATVVLVPPAVTPPDDAGPTPDELRAIAGSAHAAWRLVAPLVASVGDDGAPTVSWRGRAEGHALVLQKALRGLGSAGGTELLRAVAAVLGREGWLLRPSARDGVAVLDGRGEGVELRAEAGAGATVLTFATPVLAVGAAARSALREEVRSWG